MQKNKQITVMLSRLCSVSQQLNKDEALNKNAFRATRCVGFTLIELLVVVLIIGILSAIALPQYEKAVRRTRIAEARINLRAIIDATDRYILANGEGTTDMSKLDISVPTQTKNWRYHIEECMERGCRAVATPQFESNYTIHYFSINYDDSYWTGHFVCYPDDMENGYPICQKTFGGTPQGGTFIID